MRKVQLTANIWQRSLIRGAWEKDFSPLWNDYNRIRGSREAILASLSQEFPNFTQSCQNFIHDLRKFSGDKAARNRLDQTGHAYYLGKPYFEDNIREKILTIPTKNGTLQDDLNLLAAKRSEGEVCAAHDLSPLYEAVLGVEWDKIRGKGVALHQQIGGLSLQQQASQSGTARQLAKKGSQFFKSTFGKRGGGRRDDTSGAGGSKSAGW
jgi:hypothetical protein